MTEATNTANAPIDPGDKPCRRLVFGTLRSHDVATSLEARRVGSELVGEACRRSATMMYRYAVDGPAGSSAHT